MKILKIGGKNLASLAGEFCVDFEQEPLASSGLFAISGPTGAGKTTLLDALCLALYDATPRLARGRGGATVPDVGSETVSAQDARTLLRRGAAEAHAEVDFVGNDNLRYRARWSVRRSRGKSAGALQKSTLSLHQLPDLIALGGTKTEVANEIVNRIGLTFDQFTRAVLLAQNEFSAFLKTDENDRGELLETLTGSAIYSAISKRAFERYKAETQAMQQLSARLADHTPLTAEERCSLDAESAAAASALALADAQRTALEQQLRWHQEADKLRDNEAQAAQALEQHMAAHAAAQPRRDQLALREIAETARPLHAECARLENEALAVATALSAAEAGLKQALTVQEEAIQAAAKASEAVTHAESAQRAALPDLDKAKGLDAASAALAPSHAQALQRRKAAHEEQQAAANALEQSSATLDAAIADQQRDAAWLCEHAQLETLAVQWPRWEALLKRSESAQALATTLAADLVAAERTLASAHAAATAKQHAVSDHGAQLAVLDAARSHAAAALAAFDNDKLRSQREAMEARREAVSGAERLWSVLAAATVRHSAVLAENAVLDAAVDAAQATLTAAGAQAGAIGAALQQAERSLKVAELACADNVNALRDNLEEGAPCPVCGSESHPYKNHSGLHDMLAALRGEVATARAAAQENASSQATQTALLSGYQQQRTALLEELSQLEAELVHHRAAWTALALASEAPPQAREAWLAGQLESARTALRALDEQERAARAAARARDEAQHAFERATGAHLAAREQLAAAEADIVRCQAAHTALAEKRAQALEQAERLLEELDAAFLPGWRDAWLADPDLFASARAEQAKAWRACQARHGERATTLVALEAACVAARLRVAQAQEALATAGAAYDTIDAETRAHKAARAGLFEGRSVADVESALHGAITAARAALEQQQAASQRAAQAEARARTSHAQLTERLVAIRAQEATAAEALLAWLAAHPQIAALDELLSLDRATLAAERGALQTIDAAVATAQAVLTERRQQCELHRQAAPPADAGDAGTLSDALAELDISRKQAHDAATALRLQVAQDDVRRQNSQAMMAQIERQQQIELRWGRLNELIGSADGKKFRNYAQQFTLDVLLGYANSHLQHLAKRYRLERITSAGGPSLGLLVRDQDMGGEVRSVNSLSGGESFLVSLALALGLASLSSNRVRVESLFIDEGFGSLDSETLRVAMDALDGLQSLGRKVGVISHVQEMTERIATKVLVQPSGGGTSTVTVQ